MNTEATSTGTVVIIHEGLPEGGGIRLMLKSRGFAVVSATGADTVSPSVHPDVVVLSGESLRAISLARMLARHRNMGCGPLTLAIVDEANVSDFAAKPFADDYVSRPIIPETFFMRLRGLMRLRAAQEQFGRAGYVDPHTGLWGKESVLARTEEELSHARRKGADVACAVLRIRNLPKINEEVGYESGDVVLREVARTLRKSVRASDVLSRSGGNEFFLLLRSCSGDQAANVVKRILQPISGSRFFDGRRTLEAQMDWGAAGRGEDDSEFSAEGLVADARARLGGGVPE